MTVGIFRGWLCRELGACKPAVALELAQQPGCMWARVYRVRWRRGGPSGLGRRR